MAGKPFEWTFGYVDLAKLTGMGTNAIMQQVSRGNLDPGSLESLLLWLSRHARPSLRRRLIAHALYEDSGMKKTKTGKPE